MGLVVVVEATARASPLPARDVRLECEEMCEGKSLDFRADGVARLVGCVGGHLLGLFFTFVV